MNPHGSTTNKEKRKNKDFRMLKQNRNVRNKTKRSFREKQVKEYLFLILVVMHESGYHYNYVN